MGKRYFCDYCDRSFPDGVRNRRNHLAGAPHKRNQAQHYAQFLEVPRFLPANEPGWEKTLAEFDPAAWYCNRMQWKAFEQTSLLPNESDASSFGANQGKRKREGRIAHVGSA